MTILIAQNKDQFVNSLFSPVNGKTYDGYITRKSKTRIDFFALGSDYCINNNGVICSKRKLDNGKTWYSYANTVDWFDGYAQEQEWIKEMRA